MGEDHLKINKFLDLLPDELVKNVFYLLYRSVIREEFLGLIEEYLLYVNDIGLSFKNKTLKISHSEFFESLNTLRDFIDEHFSYGPAGVFVLEPEIRYVDSKSWGEFSIKLKELHQDTRNKYGTFRKEAERYLLGDHEDGPEISEEEDKKYSDMDESLTIKMLGIRIEGRYIFFKNKKEEIKNVDKEIIKYLHYRFRKDEQQCVPIDVLAKDLGLDEGYIKNRICIINQLVKKIILDGRTKSNLNDFIKNERGRGYHLNPRYVTQFTKKK